MDQIVRLNSQQEAILDDAADRFIALYHGNIRKALKEVIVLNAHLNDQLDQMAATRPGPIPKRAPNPDQIQRRFWF
ncbi:hypothetical protein SAMN04488498_12569 [Mesorhizobium albiziae]|uniref:Uncharacterized protein n=1 Tax=Neomesorhizobium albiziae TaxID=335020 RepID=A0A1I4EE38_9HYPH|nr:hypothetical protein [Mesorhizobium albiziae]GLS33491.1 hypothetical protein GCM10007937_52030 [Mesorhizobium albiziae]SFL04042.1 hypothetical protein SAMN04488498_12569 [Mesorhizobium albiziae]